MCELTSKYTESDTFTGYKVALKINGKYYSPATGIEYKPGRVVIPGRIDFKHSVTFFRDDLLHKGCQAYEANMTGRTAVLIHVDTNGKRLLKIIGKHLPNSRRKKTVLLRMTIGSELLKGVYEFYQSFAEQIAGITATVEVIAGKEIISMEEVS